MQNRKVCTIFLEFQWTIMVVWSSPAMLLTSVTCHLFKKTRTQVRGNCCCSQPTSISRNLIHVNRRKIGRYTRYLWNFNWPLWFPGHLRQFFYVGNVSSLRKTTARVRCNCRCHLPWTISHHCLHFAECPQFCKFISPSILRIIISHFA